MKNQFEVFASVLSNFENALNASETALNSSGSAMRENEAYMQSLEAKVNALRAEFERLVLGDGVLNNFIKLLVDSGTKLLKFANSDIGQAIIKITALTVASTLLGKGFILLSGTLIPNLIRYVSLFSNVLTGLVIKTVTFDEALKMLHLNPTMLAISAIIAVTYGLVKAFDKATLSTKELSKSISEIKGEIESLNAKESHTKEDNDKLDYLEKRLELEQEILATRQKQVALDDNETEHIQRASTYLEGGTGATASSSSYNGVQEYNKKNEEPKDNLKEFRKLTGQIYEFDTDNASVAQLNNLDNLQKKREEIRPILESERDILYRLREENGQLTDSEKIRLAQLELAVGKTQEINTETMTYAEIQRKFGEESEESDDKLKEFAKDLGISKNELVENAEGLGLGIDAYYEYASAMKDVNENVDNIQEAYGTLQTAVEEYNSANGFTIDTIQALLSLDPEYLTMLELENGQLVLNEEAIRNKMIAQAEEAKQIIYNTAIEKLNAIASEESGDASTTSSEKRKDAVAGIDEETNAINRNTMANVANKASNVVAKDGSKAKDVQKILDETKAQIDVIDEAVKNMGTNFEGSMGKAKSSTRGANSALRQQDSIVKSLKSQYKSAFDKIIASIDLQIKAIKKAKEEALKSIDAQIKALEKEKAQREKYWDDRINALKKENTERERNISLQEKEQQLALAKQTQVMLYTGEGETGFEYAQDEGAVSKAEQELFDEQQAISYERQLEQLEELKEAEMESYDERIEALQEYREKVEEEYDQQIEALEELKERAQAEYDQQVEALENFKEQSNVVWEEIVANLNESVAKYNAGLSKIKMPVIGAGGKVSFKSSGDNYVDAYASGVASIDDTSLAVVGDSPSTREIVIGSKLNTDGGVLTALRRGSGVVNHKATETVAGMLNNLNGQLNNGSTNGVLNDISNSNSNVTNLNIQSVNVEANDANDFVESMKQFSATIKQDSYSR